jgi:LCP family protein required for cell wall assembly
VVVGILLLLVLSSGGAYAWYQITLGKAVGNILNQTVARVKGETDPNQNLTNGILTGPRINILLLGSDTDQKVQFQDGHYLAQSDIVVSIDPTTKTVGMLSIPRDFYINVPGYGMHKLDEAYSAGGVATSRLTVEDVFGIKINYYAWVGLAGFIKLITTVNGVDVDVTHPIADGNYPDDVGANANNPSDYKRLYLTPGPQHLDGETALEYVRSRHADLIGDFGRSARQQQVLSALKLKLANANIFSKLNEIANDLSGSVKTEMGLTDVINLAKFMKNVDPNNITKLTLGPPYSTTGTVLINGQSISVVNPDCNKIAGDAAIAKVVGQQVTCNITAASQPASVNSNSSLASSTSSNNLAYTANSSTSICASNTTDTLVSGLSDLSNSVNPSAPDLSNLSTGLNSLIDLMLLGTGIFDAPFQF